MHTLVPPESVETLREKVAAFEREHARLRRELAATPRDPRFRVVQVAVLGLLAVSFACGLCAGEQSGFPARGARSYDRDKPLALVEAPQDLPEHDPPPAHCP
jgi:hypothetical protein